MDMPHKNLYPSGTSNSVRMMLAHLAKEPWAQVPRPRDDAANIKFCKNIQLSRKPYSRIDS